MTTTDELREAVARQLDPSAFHTLLSSEPSLRKREARSKADRIIRLVVERCAHLVETHAYRTSSTANRPVLEPSDTAHLDIHHATIAAAIRELAPNEPAP